MKNLKHKLSIIFHHPQPIAFIFYKIFGVPLTKNIFSITRNGYKLSLEDNEMSLSLFHHGKNSYREMEVLFEGLLEKGDNFIDVGGSIGMHSIYAKKIVEHGSVVMIEPIPEIIENAYKNFNLNSLNIELVTAAIGDDSNGVKMSDLEGESYILDDELHNDIAYNLSASGNNQYNNKSENILSINSCTLDSVTEMLDQISLMKIDTEGAQLFTMKSGINTLKKTNSVVLGLFNPYTTSRFSYESCDAANFLIENGFNYAYKLSGTAELTLTQLDMPNEKFDSPDYYLFSKKDIASFPSLKKHVTL